MNLVEGLVELLLMEGYSGVTTELLEMESMEKVNKPDLTDLIQKESKRLLDDPHLSPQTLAEALAWNRQAVGSLSSADSYRILP